MRRPWRLFTARGHVFVIVGLLVVVAAMVAGQRDVMRIGLLLLALPVIAAVLVARARLRLSCERSVEPARVAARLADAGTDHARPGGSAARRDPAAGGLRAGRARQPTPVRGGQGGPELAAGDRVPDARPGARPVPHRSADGAHHRSVRTGPAGPPLPGDHRGDDHAGGGDPARDAVGRRRGQRRRGPTAPRRRHGSGRRAGPRVPAGRRPSPHPLALHRPSR